MSDNELKLVSAEFNRHGKFFHERIETTLNSGNGIHALFFSGPRPLHGRPPQLYEHKCYLFEVGSELEEIRRRKYAAGTPHKSMAMDRNEFRRGTREFVEEGGVPGKLKCEKCDEEYIYRASFDKHRNECYQETRAAATQLRD